MKPGIAMVVVLYKVRPNDKTSPVLLAKKADNSKEGLKTLWNADITDGETPVEAAVRAMNTFFHGTYKPHMLMRLGEVESETSMNHIYLLSGVHVLPEHIRQPKLATRISLRWLERHVGSMTLNGKAAVIGTLPVYELMDILQPHTM